MEITRIQIRAPKGNDPGKVLERHFKVIGDTSSAAEEKDSEKKKRPRLRGRRSLLLSRY